MRSKPIYLVLAGLLGTILFGLISALVILLHLVADCHEQGIDNPIQLYMRHYISSWGAGCDAWLYSIQRINLILMGISLLPFAVGLWLSLSKDRNSSIGSLLIAVFGLGLMLMGMFPFTVNLSSSHELGSHEIHFLAFLLAFCSVIGACFILSRAFDKKRWHILRTLSLLIGVTVSILFFSIFLLFGQIGWLPTDRKGLGQNLPFIIWLWLVLIAVGLLRARDCNDSAQSNVET